MSELRNFDTVWPQTVDPQSLFTSEGMVDIDAVERYLQSLPKKAKEIPASPLDELSLQIKTTTVDIPEDNLPELPADFDPKEWQRNNPIDFAVSAFLVHMVRRNEAFQRVWPSDTLVEDSTVKLNFEKESVRYVDFLRENMPEDFAHMLQSAESMGLSHNDVNEVDCIIAIPVAGHQEYENIFHTLEQFAQQDMSPRKYEIVLYLNMPGKGGENDAELTERLYLTLNEIDRFRQQYPNVVVRTATTTYRIGEPTIGAIRAELWNALTYDLIQRGRQDDVLVISSDADIVTLNSVYLSDMTSTFQNQKVDIVAAQLRWQPVPDIPYNSPVNKILRYQTFLDNVRDRHADTLHTADANTGISLAMYMAVGGYHRGMALGEMSNIVNRIRYWRQSNEQREANNYIAPEKPMEAKAPQAALRTHSRRLIKAMALGYSPYNAWDQRLITFGADDALRTEQAPGLLANENAKRLGRKWVSSMTGPYVDGIDSDKKRRILSTAHRMLGFDEL
ncbi:MAG: hypothetical protein JWM52_825 [Candidatus Saccharibacteria bacterium]|nr:hypothetical protein [Candidatus Saccharibacteria bacterium]